MHSQGRRPYDSQSLSSQTSNATSRVTTLSDASDHDDRFAQLKPVGSISSTPQPNRTLSDIKSNRR